MGDRHTSMRTDAMAMLDEREKKRFDVLARHCSSYRSMHPSMSSACPCLGWYLWYPAIQRHPLWRHQHACLRDPYLHRKAWSQSLDLLDQIRRLSATATLHNPYGWRFTGATRRCLRHGLRMPVSRMDGVDEVSASGTYQPRVAHQDRKGPQSQSKPNRRASGTRRAATWGRFWAGWGGMGQGWR